MTTKDLIDKLTKLDQPDAEITINIRCTTETGQIWKCGDIQDVYSPKPGLIVFDSLD